MPTVSKQHPCSHVVDLMVRRRQIVNKSADKRLLQVVIRVPTTVSHDDGKMSNWWRVLVERIHSVQSFSEEVMFEPIQLI